MCGQLGGVSLPQRAVPRAHAAGSSKAGTLVSMARPPRLTGDGVSLPLAP